MATNNNRLLLVLSLILATVILPSNGSQCDLINVGTTQDGTEVIKHGILQKQYDRRITAKNLLYYVPYERESGIFYISTPVPLTDSPYVRTSER
jgi:hypothetical protein